MVSHGSRHNQARERGPHRRASTCSSMPVCCKHSCILEWRKGSACSCTLSTRTLLDYFAFQHETFPGCLSCTRRCCVNCCVCFCMCTHARTHTCERLLNLRPSGVQRRSPPPPAPHYNFRSLFAFIWQLLNRKPLRPLQPSPPASQKLCPVLASSLSRFRSFAR